MNKISFVFPGVGSQFTGMGKELYHEFPVFKDTIEEASDLAGADIFKIWQDGEQKLNELNFAQISLLSISYASYRVLQAELDVEPAMMIGHSLGEYTALCCDGILNFSEAIPLVQKRGECIIATSEQLEGTMLWVINIDTQVVEGVCEQLRSDAIEVYLSAYDTATQCSISCYNKDIFAIAKALEDKGALVYPLNLSGPFHSPLMQQAAKDFNTVLEGYTFNSQTSKVIANETARPYTDDVKGHLTRQLVSPVKWFQSLGVLEASGCTTIIEVGPKEVLTYLTQKSEKPLKAYSFNSIQHLNTLKNDLMVAEEEYLMKISGCRGVAVGTRNYYPENSNYHQDIVSPYNEITKIEKRIKEGYEVASEHHLKQALGHLNTILNNKRVPQDIQRASLAKLLSDKFIHLV
ncbi:ACP S-malonyltransferase [Fulvivirga sediminis]|uniref:[acyl-carrier-protein] S-malonyltransferase n=1 Tax=Fulvivirga sediminis TaxID=2803949 RepID=A0A937F9E9_9BACT|nr:ACP S-malonyltransferase [Fulvivirga sediminis]MBL3658746.1 ACP S-malonyltransferase [Fulvivirga sediminis]